MTTSRNAAKGAAIGHRAGGGGVARKVVLLAQLPTRLGLTETQVEAERTLSGASSSDASDQTDASSRDPR